MFKNTNLFSDAEKIKSTRVLCALSALFFALFSIVDLWAMPSSTYEAGIVRAISIVCFILTYGLTYTSFFAKYHDSIVLTTFLVAVSSIDYMIFIAKPDEYAYYTYFVGLLLVSVTLFSWTYIHIVKSALAAMLAITVYVIIEIYGRESGAVLGYPIVIINVLFIVSALLIGLVARLMRDKFQYENYVLQQSLKEIVEQKTIEAKDNAYLANHDSLTGLPNRRYVTQLLEESLEIAKKEDKILAILFLDLNGFKQVNDIYGHAVGDEVLIVVAKRLEYAIRDGDNLSRLAGDEFLVGLLMEKENISEVNKMMAEFTAILSKPMNIDGVSLEVGASIGVAAYPMHGNKINVLINIADQKMYKIKKGVKEVIRNREQAELASESVVIFPGNSRNG